MVRRPWLFAALLAIGVSGLAAAKGKRTRGVPNMPAGWSWPPTAAMKDAGAKCLAGLEARKVAFERAKPAKKITTPLVLPDLELAPIRLESIWRKPPFVMDCHLALGMAVHASALRQLGVVAVRFSTIHDYRTIKKRGRRTRILSRHAIGLAMDVYGFELEDGTILEVERDYPDPRLLAIEHVLNSSGTFRTLLTPGNDPKTHGDHFHIEARMPLRP